MAFAQPNATCNDHSSCETSEDTHLAQLRTKVIMAQRGGIHGDSRDETINDWNTIGNNIRYLNWKFGDDTDLSWLGNSFYAAGGTIQMASDLIKGGGNIGASIITAAQAFVPLLGCLNPAAGLAAGLFLSLFGGPSKADQLQAVLDKMMNAMKEYVEQQFVQEAVNNAQGTVLKATKLLNENPLFVSEPNSSYNEDEMKVYNASRADFWNELNDFFDLTIDKVFYSTNCLDLTPGTTSTWEPLVPAPQPCIDFDKQGMITNQVQTAQLHIQAGMEVARIESGNPDVAKQKLRAVESNRKMYFRLLAASLANFLTYREQLSCSNMLHYPSGWGDVSWSGAHDCHSCCCGFNDFPYDSPLTDPITGTAINTYYKNPCNTKFCPNDDNQEKDQCTKAPYENMCADKHFKQFYDDWVQNTTFDIGAKIRSFQVTFDVTKNSTCGRPESRMRLVSSSVSLEGCQGLCYSLLSCDGFQFELPNATAVNGTCKLSSVPGSLIGKDCPSEGCGEGAWCSSTDNKCYEGCFSTAERCGSDIPRRASYWCNYSPDARPTCGTTNPNCPGQDAPCGEVPLPDVAAWAELAKNQYCSSYKSFNGYAGINVTEECAAKCADCNAVSIDHSKAACKVWQDCVVSVTLTETSDTFYFKEEATSPGRLDGLTTCGMMRVTGASFD
eukprot:TRINITY_DN95387_c0_g1_i1.p1 TRINITY_DN95387_c0_g1~~TRINITY_DN95387_c0_g1_i1.p1  ORF type:complete len:704 (-),score=101.69 TRINITY_DN95387_c0_g1_i1:2-2008(-)